MFYGLLETYHDFSEGFMMALYGWSDADHIEGAEPQDAVGDYPEHPLSQQAAQTWFDFFPPPVPAWIAMDTSDVECWKCRRRLRLICYHLSHCVGDLNSRQQLNFDRKDSDYL